MFEAGNRHLGSLFLVPVFRVAASAPKLPPDIGQLGREGRAANRYAPLAMKAAPAFRAAEAHERTERRSVELVL